MLIDWFTVVAQIVNFLILVALLKRFLYGRIVRAMDERESRIAGRLAEAEQKNQEVQRQLEQCRCQALELESKREEMLSQAKQDADRKRNELLDRARQSVNALEARWRDEWEKEKHAVLEEFRRRTAGQVLEIARRAVADLASEDLEDRAVRVFLEKLRALPRTAIEALGRDPITVLSGREIPEPVRREIRAVLETQLGAPVELRFDRLAGPGWGIELRGHGCKIGWSSDTYLDSLEAKVAGALATSDSEVLTAK